MGTAATTAAYLAGAYFGVVQLGRRPAALASGATVALVAGALAWNLGPLLTPSGMFQGKIVLAEWIRRSLPPGARLFQVDVSGMIGYFSERSLINGDGLIDGWEYQDSLRAGRAPEYLAEKGVTHWSRTNGRGPAG